jgi:hypothetical protein
MFCFFERVKLQNNGGMAKRFFFFFLCRQHFWKRVAAWLSAMQEYAVLQYQFRCVAIGAPLCPNGASFATQRGPRCDLIEARLQDVENQVVRNFVFA